MSDDTTKLVALGSWRYYTMVIYESLLLFGVLFFAGVLALFASSWWLQVELISTEVEHSQLYEGLWYSLYLGATAFLYFAWQWRRSRQTLSMAAWGVYIIQADASERRISWGQALTRFIVASLVYLSLIYANYWTFFADSTTWLAMPFWLIFVLSMISPWFDIYHRTWQDLASGTRLVRRI
jgi:uncharacterized RDD family membrane protein YckC